MICSRCIIEKKVKMIAITMEYYHQMDRWMVLVDIWKYGLINIVLDSITVGDLKKIKKMDKDIWYIMLLMMIGMYTWDNLKIIKEKVMESR